MMKPVQTEKEASIAQRRKRETGSDDVVEKGTR